MRDASVGKFGPFTEQFLVADVALVEPGNSRTKDNVDPI